MAAPTPSTAMSPTSKTSPMTLSPSTQTAGVKRKRVTEAKFYAVRTGRVPGIYQTWSECLDQVKGHKGATFQAFPLLSDAEAFMKGESVTQINARSGNPKSNRPTKFYGVQVGKVPGVYTDWPSAQAQIIGWKGPKHRKFDSHAEAQAFVQGAQQNGQTNGIQVNGTGIEGPYGKKQRAEAGLVMGEQTGVLDGPGVWPLPHGHVDNFDPNVKLGEDGKIRYKTMEEKKRTKVMPRNGQKPAGLLKIYTDGSSLNNGQNDAIGGVGVYFGPGHKSNISEPLPGPRQTNQRAELTALLRALEIAPLHRPVEIYTDSRYAIGCISQWYDNWVRNGWVTSKGARVENRDLIEEIRGRMDARGEYGVATGFIWVKGHSADEGNRMADRLAVLGANGGGGHAAAWEDDDEIAGGDSEDDRVDDDEEDRAGAEVTPTDAETRGTGDGVVVENGTTTRTTDMSNGNGTNGT